MDDTSDRRREIKRLLALRDSEGMTYRELSEHSGIPLGTLNWWAQRVRRESADGDDGFVHAGDVELGGSTNSSATAPDVRLLHPCGLVIELRGDYADQVLSVVLQDVLSWS